MEKVCILLVLIAYVYHNIRFRKRKINKIILYYKAIIKKNIFK
jgi:hypothetical protein